MECLCQRMLHRSIQANWPTASRINVNGMKCKRTVMTTTSRRTAKLSKPPLKTREIPKYKTPTRKPPPPPSHDTEAKTNPFRYRSTAFLICGITAFGFSGYLAYLYITLTKPLTETVPIAASEQQDVSSRYDTIASRFDSEVDSMEWMMGITKLRKKLASMARGDVLEVSIGTGRNLGFYAWDFQGHNGVGKVDGRGDIKRGNVRSFTAVDKSAEMLEVAHEKFGKLFPGILGVRWVIADAAEPGAIPGPPRSANERSGNKNEKYDTVVQTMGLCSVSDPVASLRNLGKLVKEEDGRILLLEHGRGRWEWLNGVLDRSAEGHARSFGCWWNRDVRGIVRESGLEVVRMETPKWWHGGTTWWIELKKPRGEAKSPPDHEVVRTVDAALKEPCCSVVAEKEPEKCTQQEPVKEMKKGWW